MDVDKNKAVVRRFLEEAWNKGNPAAADDYIAANCVTSSVIVTPFAFIWSAACAETFT